MNIVKHECGWLYLSNKGPGRLAYPIFISLVHYLKSIYPHCLEEVGSQPVYCFNTTEDKLKESVRRYLESLPC